MLTLTLHPGLLLWPTTRYDFFLFLDDFVQNVHFARGERAPIVKRIPCTGVKLIYSLIGSTYRYLLYCVSHNHFTCRHLII